MTTEAPSVILPRRRATELRIIGGVSAAHFVSHFYFLLLPPVFMSVRADYGVSFTELGLAIAAFNIVSAIFQTPAGILADRIGPYSVLVVGLALESIAFGLVGIVPSYWFLVAMFGIAGLANTVYHPADYALLSHHIAKERVGQAFSIHTFSGMLGSAVAPAGVLFLQTLIGWRGAFIASAIGGLIVTALLVVQRDDYARSPHAAAPSPASAEGARADRWRLLTSAPIMRSFAFFTLLAAISVGIQNYSVVALTALFATPAVTGNMALTGHLLLTSIGVLLGGFLVGRLRNHALFAAGGLVVTAATILLVGIADLGAVMLISLMALGGFASGVIMPSRDMLVREVTPPGSFGTVFGFVTTGFNVAGVFFPLIFGALMDHGNPRLVFLVTAACCLLSLGTVVAGRRPKPAAVGG